MVDCRFVDRQELEGGFITDVHRTRIGIKKHPIFFVLLV